VSPPLATYRLQLHAGFGFDAAAAVVPYLAALGVSHLYTSPILQAEPGSTHGYDVVDHDRISEDLGGAAAFERLVAALRGAGMGLVVDIVPNHMAVSPANAWWWDVLQHGPASRYARYFDVYWEPSDSRLREVIMLPVLGDHYERALEARALCLDRRGTSVVVTHGDRSFPLDPASLSPVIGDAAARAGSAELGLIAQLLGELPASTTTSPRQLERRHRDAATLAERIATLADQPGLQAALDETLVAINEDAGRLGALLEAQNYRLAHWRSSSPGYRRFFDIDSLVGLRVERPEVFEATHRRILERVARGEISGLRIDHPDGLRDPAGYFARLRDAAPRAWIVAEKILQPGEVMRDWPIDGTTGYGFANLATGLQVDPAGEGPMTDAYGRLADADTDWSRVAAEARRHALGEQLGGDLNRLTERWVGICEADRRFRDVTRHELHEALVELAAALPVYRTYVRAPEREVHDADRTVIGLAAQIAVRRRPDLDPDLFSFLAAILLLQVPGDAANELAMRFQQLTPAAMAKGIEDTALYRYLRLVALNEVGGDPGTFGRDAGAFHAAVAAEHERWPAAMLTTSTHDTKRSEDVRARLSLLAEQPDAWEGTVRKLLRAASGHRTSRSLPGAKAEYLLFQTLIGAWPLTADRCLAYMQKATREAKEQTSWLSPDPTFDAALAALVRGCLADARFVEEVEGAVAPLVEPGRANALALLLWKLTAPGVPDLYQGSELWDLSLVDPDNRRPVDFERRRQLLAESEELSLAEVIGRADDGLSKLWLVRRTLSLRRRRPADLGPEGAYRPLAPLGPAADHCVAYVRGDGVLAIAPRLPLKLRAAGGWRETRLPVPDAVWRNVLTDTEHAGPELDLGELLRDFPVALLERMS
jgi:(1->4)-alpha-D-glucan 1-alpha-D-glucosylmutase